MYCWLSGEIILYATVLNIKISPIDFLTITDSGECKQYCMQLVGSLVHNEESHIKLQCTCAWVIMSTKPVFFACLIHCLECKWL